MTTAPPGTAIDHSGDDFGDDPRAGPRSELSMLSVVAFVFSVLVCIPFALPIGAILGIVALVRLAGQPHLRGRGLALGAVVLGTCFSIGWGVGAWTLLSRARSFIAFVNDVPRDAFEAGFAGDIDGFRAPFPTLPDRDAAEAFIEELRARYGDFVDLTQVGPASATAGDADATDRRLVWRYRAAFTDGFANMDIELVGDPDGGDRLWLDSITVIDRAHPSLRFPPLPPPPTLDTIRERRTPEAGERSDGDAP